MTARAWAHSLEGISQPVQVFQVLHEGTARNRFEVSEATGLTPLVGREQEVGPLLARWEQTTDGVGQAVLISGEAGIGKTRLVEALKGHVAQDPSAWLTPLYCSPYHQNSALYPMIDLLEHVVLQFTPEDSSHDKLNKIEGFLAQYRFFTDETVALFASLLSVPFDDRYVPLNLTPERQRQKTMEALLGILMEIARHRPVLFVVEDLQWADPSTLELLGLLIDQSKASRIFVLFTARADFISPWPTRSHWTQITLNRLSQRQVKEMVERVAGGKTLPDEVLEQIANRTDGVPLFIEELTKMILESGLLKNKGDRYELTGPLPPMAIPTTLQDSLAARLDRLDVSRVVAQLGATLGREFSNELIRAVSTMDEEALEQGLQRLLEAELVYYRGFPPHIRYK